MGPPGIVVPDHFEKFNIIFQKCGGIDTSILTGTLIGNIENSAHQLIMTNDQVLDPAKIENKFDSRNKPVPSRMAKAVEKEFNSKAKIQVSQNFKLDMRV
jgi:hypothetical protein